MRVFFLVLASCCFVCLSFNVLPTQSNRLLQLRMRAGNDSIKLSTIFTSLAILSSTVSYPTRSFGAVGEGDLPNGALAFTRLLKYQGDWDKLADSIKLRKDEIDAKETLNIKFVLKQLANEYYDMDVVANGILDPTKKASAKELAKDFRLKMRECDDAASDGNLQKIIDVYPETKKELTDFFGLLQDVPDEL